MDKQIVYITSSFPFGNSESWACNEINSLQELGCNVIIIPKTGKGRIINQNAIKFSSNLIDLPFINWSILTLSLKTILFKPCLFLKLIVEIVKQSNSLINFLKGLAVLPKSLYLSEVLKSKKIDHIHSLSTTTPAVIAHIISSNLKVPWSYTLHSSSILNSKYKRSFMFQSESASKCRAISQITANDLSNFVGLPLSKKVSMVHLGVDIKGFKKDKCIINDPFIIATPSELSLHKGHIYAFDAAKKLIDAGVSNFNWFFYGDGPLLKEFKKKIKELNLNNNCYLLGNLDHQRLLDKYKNHEIDAVISSSISIPDIFEGIPVSLMEAMSYQIPVIATDCGGTKELVDGQSGILVNQRDPEAIANAISKLMNNHEFIRKLGNNGRNKVMEDFDTMKNASELIKLF